jgi:hypothetical protein
MYPLTFWIAVGVGSLAWILGWAALGLYIAAEKNRDLVEGGLIGGLFGPIGVLVVAMLPAKQPPASRPESGINLYGPDAEQDDDVATAAFLRRLEKRA